MRIFLKARLGVLEGKSHCKARQEGVFRRVLASLRRAETSDLAGTGTIWFSPPGQFGLTPPDEAVKQMLFLTIWDEAMSAQKNRTDYYEFLQISPSADQETIHRVYRFLAARYH